MKAIMISDHAKWCAKIMNGDKTVEVRKGTALYKAIQKLIKQYGYADIYVYCTKGKSLIYTDGTDGKGDYVDYKYYESYKDDKNDIGSGKVLFKFRCYKVEEINTSDGKYWTVDYIFEESLKRVSCLTHRELDNYLQYGLGCAIHISDLEIFDKPKELWEFQVRVFPNRKDNLLTRELTKAPQSWQFVESEQ